MSPPCAWTISLSLFQAAPLPTACLSLVRASSAFSALPPSTSISAESASVISVKSSAGRISQGQPGCVVARHGAVEQAHALVLQVQLETAFLADAQLPQVDRRRLDPELRRIEDLRGQLAQELVQELTAQQQALGAEPWHKERTRQHQAPDEGTGHTR